MISNSDHVLKWGLLPSILFVNLMILLNTFEPIFGQENTDPSFFSTDPLWTSNSPTDANCQVDIRGDSTIMYPGNFTSLKAVVSGAIPEGYAWAIEPDIVKSYDDRVFTTDEETGQGLLSSVDPVTPMAPSDFQKSTVSFYWKPEADIDRTVGVRVLTENGVCQDIETYKVQTGNTSNTQPEDFYVATNNPIGPSTRVLQEHAAWHGQYREMEPSYVDKGDLFFQFHKAFLAHFDTFRNEFGYKPIEMWNPGNSIPNGTDVDHESRTNPIPYTPLSLPSWFVAYPSGNGLVERQDAPFPDTPRAAMECELGDAPNPSWPDLTQDSLNDFEPDKELLGCVLTHPYHNLRHVNVSGGGGDMGFVDTAPKDPMFWRLHKFIDKVSDNSSKLTPFGTINNAGAIPEISNSRLITDAFLTQLDGNGTILEQLTVAKIVSNDTSPPQIESRDPQTILPFIKDKLSEVSVTFSEPVKNVLANDLTINDSPATSVEGLGLGPYVFTGFNQPLHGNVNVTLIPGHIEDLNGNIFKGDSWDYSLVKSNSDGDNDGILDGLEISEFLTNPVIPDTDEDTIPDGAEVDLGCLNPLVDDSKVVNFAGTVVNSTGRDFDNDGTTNVDEFDKGTSPCIP